MATTVYGESNTVGGGNAYRYITANYIRNAATGPLYLYYAGVNYNKGYGAAQAGSLVSVSVTGATSPASSSDVQIFKNGTLWFTAMTVSFSTGILVFSANYSIGTKAYAQGDYFDVYLTSGAGIYVGASLLFAEPGP